MKIIEVDEAQARLHEMWDAILADGIVQFTRDGRSASSMTWIGTPEDRLSVIQELFDTIGYSAD